MHDFVREVLAGLAQETPKMPDTRKSIYLIMSAMTAYYESNGEEPHRRELIPRHTRRLDGPSDHRCIFYKIPLATRRKETSKGRNEKKTNQRHLPMLVGEIESDTNSSMRFAGRPVASFEATIADSFNTNFSASRHTIPALPCENKGHLTPMQFLPMYFDSFDEDEDGGYEDVTEADEANARRDAKDE